MGGQIGGTLRNHDKSKLSRLGATLFDDIFTQPSPPEYLGVVKVQMAHVVWSYIKQVLQSF